MNNEKFEVFISYKHSDEGIATEDVQIAKEVFQALTRRGVKAFFSDESVFMMGKSDYKKAIDSALDTAKLLLVIATRESYLTSGWVEYEYESFYEDILSGKKEGNIISYTCNIDVHQLPRTLSRFQNYLMGDTDIKKVVDFICTALNKLHRDPLEKPLMPINSLQNIVPEQNGLRSPKGGSNYTSDYSNELKRLEIQAQNAKRSDQMALEYLFSHHTWPQDEKITVLDIGSAYGFVAADRFGNDERVERILCIDYNQRVIERAEIIFAEKEKMAFEVLDIESPDFEKNLRAVIEKLGLKKIHIFYSALTLHHLKDPNRFLRRIRKFMSDDSFIVLRGSDDGSKLCFPHSELMEEIIYKSAHASGASDRFNGRKIYSQLANSGFKNIRIFSDMKDISEFDYDERESLFLESFAYRVNYYKREVEKNPDNREANEDLEWMTEALEEFETNFFEKNFWYCEYDYIGVAQKE